MPTIESGRVIEGAYGAPIRHPGVPVDGPAGTGVGSIRGRILIDTANGKLYVNIGTPASPVWQVMGLQS